jgi:hypothetical protein
MLNALLYRRSSSVGRPGSWGPKEDRAELGSVLEFNREFGASAPGREARAVALKTTIEKRGDRTALSGRHRAVCRFLSELWVGTGKSVPVMNEPRLRRTSTPVFSIARRAYAHAEVLCSRPQTDS